MFDGIALTFDSVAHCVINRLENSALVLEFYFNLLRVNINVDRILRHVDFYVSERKARFRNQRLISFVQSLSNRPILDDAPINYKRLPRAIAFQNVGLGDVAAQI